jgi:phosphoribosylformylglycinamidine cyclo-ligase
VSDTKKTPGLTYAKSGVDYAAIDPAKVMAQRAAAATSGLLGRWGLSEVAASRGESAFVWEEPDAYRALVLECLGTKVLVADAVRPISGRTHYDALAQDTVAMAANDVAAMGAEPQVLSAYWAIGDSSWFDDRERAADLAQGWARACQAVGATWGGGETPALGGVVEPGAIDLAAACLGVVRPKSRLALAQRLVAGDRVVLLASSGIHANGLSLARHIAETLPDGYATDIGDGQRYGEALLRPTHLYAALLRDVHEAGLEVHYMSNITGHGWRKIMRAGRELSYVMHTVPPLTPLFVFLLQRGGLEASEAYGSLNMGAGFALFCPEPSALAVPAIARRHGVEAWVAGEVQDGPRQVAIEPLGLVYGSGSLEVRS